MAGKRADPNGRRALPRGPQALPREEVMADQRRRLFEAMIELLNECGFAGVRISELVARAGISRRSFYEHFHNKEECLLAAFDASAQRLERRMIKAYDPKADARGQIEAIVGALFAATAERPAAARLVCVDISAAGPDGVERWAAGAARFELALSTVFAQAPGEGTLPEPVAKAVVGALRKILYARALEGTTPRVLRAELDRALPGVVAWITAYYPSPPGVPRRPRQQRGSRRGSGQDAARGGGRAGGRGGARGDGQRDEHGGRQRDERGDGQGGRHGGRQRDERGDGQGDGHGDRQRDERGDGRGGRRGGGRAPGSLVTLSPGGLPGMPRGLPTGDHNLPRGFVEHNQRERIFDAIANLTAAHGYPAVGLEDIAAAAAISLQTFYGHFENKEEAFIATYEVGHARAQTVCAEAFAAEPNWIAGVHAGISALFEFLAAEPSYAHLACVDVVLAFPRLTERMQRTNSSYAELLDFGISSYRRARPSRNDAQPSAIVSEAIVGGIFELMYDYVARGLAERLPELADHATYIALTPFLGAEKAAAAAFSPAPRP
jgi:AcrR family transcriptional regulator